MKTRHAFFLIFCIITLPCVVFADDIAIYGTQSVTVEPNVLILFDTSGSMKETVEGSAISDGVDDTYDPSTVYSGRFPTQATYYQGWGGWRKYNDDVAEITNETVRQALLQDGYSQVTFETNWGGTWDTWMRLGNYWNFLERPVSSDRTRLEIAKDVVTELLEETTGVNFGLMELNSCHGGLLVSECGTDNVAIASEVAKLSAGGGTPLAEALAEAGLYYAGKRGHFSHTSSKYTSPIQYTCQKNYVILFTDGEATCDEDPILYTADAYMGKTIGDYDKDKKDLYEDGRVHRYASDDAPSQLWKVDNGTTDFLDDVADFLYESDLSPLGEGTTLNKQNVITHTIGFTVDHDLLGRAATDGGGSYYKASRASDLKEAFVKILSSIAEESSTFVAPVVPVNRDQRTADADSIYLAFFKPEQIGDWKGNLKKYSLSESGDILDASGNIAVNPDGTMKENSKSLWTSSERDGADVLKGGSGEKILGQTSRNFYTYTGKSEKNLVSAVNSFDSSNSDLLALGVTADQITEAKAGIGGWPIGSIIHSEPVVVHYSSSSSVIYFGSNDGFLRAINDATGEEIWAFIPPGQLSRLSLLSDNNYDYYVDATPSVAYGDLMPGTTLFEPETLLVGERRGGKSYYALDISSSSQPKYKYEIDVNYLSGSGGELLGQSWGAPTSCSVKVGSDTDAKVFILPGGYDNNQDKLSPDSEDSVGRALFAVKVSDGTLVGLNVNNGNWDSMSHSIVDLYAVDSNSNGVTSRVYAGDMKGQVFVISDDKNDTVRDGSRLIEDKLADGSWSFKNLLFTCDEGKLFYAPVPADVNGVETLYFGTGNRANPLCAESNRFYAVRNNWYDTGLSDSDLVDVMDESVSYANSLKTKKGWYFGFTHTNEKVVSRALVYSDVVYFTTYTPSESNTQGIGSDPCLNVGARGVGRLYAVSAIDGTSVTDWGTGTKCRFVDLPGNLPIAKPVLDGDNIRVGPMKWGAIKDDKDSYFYWKQRP